MQPVPGSLWKCLKPSTLVYDGPSIKSNGELYSRMQQDQLFMVIGQIREKGTYRDFVLISVFSWSPREQNSALPHVKQSFNWVSRAIFNNGSGSVAEVVSCSPEARD